MQFNDHGGKGSGGREKGQGRGGEQRRTKSEREAFPALCVQSFFKTKIMRRKKQGWETASNLRMVLYGLFSRLGRSLVGQRESPNTIIHDTEESSLAGDPSLLGNPVRLATGPSHPSSLSSWHVHAVSDVCCPCYGSAHATIRPTTSLCTTSGTLRPGLLHDTLTLELRCML